MKDIKNRRFLGSLRNRKGFQREENNFILVIIGIVAIVGIVGLLNFNGMTGKYITDSTQILPSTGEAVYCGKDICEDEFGIGNCGLYQTNENVCVLATDKETGQTWHIYWNKK